MIGSHIAHRHHPPAETQKRERPARNAPAPVAGAGRWLALFQSNYYPDFLVKLTDGRIVIVETKGQADLDAPQKMARLRQWCEDVNRAQAAVRYDFVYVDQEGFERYRPGSFRELVAGFGGYQEGM